LNITPLTSNNFTQNAAASFLFNLRTFFLSGGNWRESKGEQRGQKRQNFLVTSGDLPVFKLTVYKLLSFGVLLRERAFHFIWVSISRG